MPSSFEDNGFFDEKREDPLPYLQRLQKRLGIPDPVAKDALRIYTETVKRKLTMGWGINTLLSASIFCALRVHGIPRTIEEITKIAQIPKKKVIKSYRLILMEILPNLNFFKLKAKSVQEETHVNFDLIIQKLEEIKIPDGFERELIIIGDHAYIVVEKVQTFLGKKEVTKEISRVGAIPEGVFFVEDYSPRIHSENGKILAIEILKRTGAKKRKPLPKDDDDNDHFPYPYIFTHPRPPDDFAGASQVQLRTPLKEKDSESEVNCQYCGMKLTREEQFTHSCKKKPKTL